MYFIFVERSALAFLVLTHLSLVLLRVYTMHLQSLVPHHLSGLCSHLFLYQSPSSPCPYAHFRKLRLAWLKHTCNAVGGRTWADILYEFTLSSRFFDVFGVIDWFYCFHLPSSESVLIPNLVSFLFPPLLPRERLMLHSPWLVQDPHLELVSVVQGLSTSSSCNWAYNDLSKEEFWVSLSITKSFLAIYCLL